VTLCHLGERELGEWLEMRTEIFTDIMENPAITGLPSNTHSVDWTIQGFQTKIQRVAGVQIRSKKIQGSTQ